LLDLPLAAGLETGKVIDLIPGRCDFDESLKECGYSGALFWPGGNGALPVLLLTGTITAVPEPSVIALFFTLLLGTVL